jgi:hypothetical protein
MDNDSRSWKSSLRFAFSYRKWAGYAISLLGVVQLLIHWGWYLLNVGGNLDLSWHVAEHLGVTTSMLATAILWPWTGIILIVIGVLYVIFIGEPPSGVQRHQAWPYVGWAIFAFVFASMVNYDNSCLIYLSRTYQLMGKRRV